MQVPTSDRDPKLFGNLHARPTNACPKSKHQDMQNNGARGGEDTPQFSVGVPEIKMSRRPSRPSTLYLSRQLQRLFEVFDSNFVPIIPDVCQL